MIFRKIYSFLTSAKLALVLLVAILFCCVVGVTILRGDRAWPLIFNTLWFNGLLVLLVVNVGCCFFSRIWGRKVTVISFGMILFHLSFVAILCGIIYNSLFYFRGVIRLTEGETLSSGQRESYDYAEHGRFFRYAWLRGETTLIKAHMGYTVGGEDKKAAYEIEVDHGRAKKRGIIYVTNNLTHNGFHYYNDKEGFSILAILFDKKGRELYGVHIPLQGLKQKDDSYLYTTGTKLGPGTVVFPYNPEKPLFKLQVIYQPYKPTARTGDVIFKVWPLAEPDADRQENYHVESAGDGIAMTGLHARVDESMKNPHVENTGGVLPDASLKDKPRAEKKAAVGEKIQLGGYYLLAKEVRYWVTMSVRFEPGKPIVLASLWVGLAGIVITFIGRIRKSKR